MKSTSKVLICALLLLAAGRSAQAQPSIWTNTDVDNSWQNVDNWSAGVPTTATTAQFDDTGANSATPLTLSSASVGTLNFLNSVNNYTLGSSTSDTLTFGGANALNQSGGVSTTNNTIAAQIIATGLTGNISSGTLNLTNGANNIDISSSFNVSNNATLNVTTTGLGAAGVALNGGNLVLGGGGTNFNGLLGNFWALSPGQGATSEGAGSNNSYWGAVGLNDATSAGVIHGVLTTAGTPVVANNVLPNNIAQVTPASGTSSGGATYTAAAYGTPNNPFGGTAPATGYVGGIDFPNSVNAQNAFAALGVNISGTSGANAGAAGGYSPTVDGTTTVAQYNSIMADWSGTMNLAHAGVLNFNIDSDDASFILVDGKVVDMRLNAAGGGGFSGANSSGGQGTEGATVVLSAGAHTIEVAYDQGNGGWGVVGMYSFTPTGGATGPTTYIGNNDTTTADGVTFSSTLNSSGINNNNPISSTGASSLSVNTSSAASVGVLTLNNGTNLTITGTTPSLSFASTTITGATATFTNSMPVEPGLITATGGLTTLTMAGSNIVYLDNTGNASAFGSGVTIASTGGSAVVGVNVGGVDSLGAATLAVAGGNFSLGTDNGTNTFANPISVSGSGGTITGQQLGAGTTSSGQTISLNGDIALNGNLNLNTVNTNFTIGGSISGGGSLTYNSGGNTVNLNVANSGFTGTYNSNTGTTNDNAVGGLTNNSTNINNGSTLNIQAQGETLGNTSVNNGYLSLTQGSINIANTTVQTGGQLNILSDQGVAGGGGAGVAPTNAIQGTVLLQSSVSSGYNLTMANNSNFEADGGNRTFSSNLALQGNTNLGSNNNSFALAGALTGAGGVTQNGTGTTTISNTATAGYGGATTINSGTLALQTNLTGGGAVNVNAGTLALQANLTGGGAVNVNAAAATLNIQSGGLGSSPLTSIGAVNLTGAGASLGSGAVSMTGTSAALTFNAGASNTASYTGSSIGLNGGATLQVTSGNANLGTAMITGNNYSATPGLLEGRILNNQNDLTDPNPGNGGIQLGPLAAYTNYTTNNDGSTTPVGAHEWSNNTTWQYTGQIYITANEAAVGITFAKNIDDNTQLQIDGKTWISSSTYNSPAGAYITGLTQGWHDFSLIIGNGTGGAGWVASTSDNFGGAIISSLPGNEASLYTNLSVGMGFGYADGNPLGLTANAATQGTPDNAGDSLNVTFDNGTGNLFQVPAPGSTISVAAGTSLTAGSIASAQTLNLSGGLTLDSGTSASNSVVQQVTVAAGAAATLNLGGNNVFSPIATSIIDGGSSLTLNGLGRFEVVAGATFTIGQSDTSTSLAVTNGEFRVDAGGVVSGPGSVTVSDSGILAGGGIVGVNTTVGSGGTIAPSDAANMTVSALTLNDGSNLSYNLTMPGELGPTWGMHNDLVSVNSALSLSTSDGAITVNIPTAGFGGAGMYELLSYGSTNNTNVNEFHTGTVPGGYTYQFVNVSDGGTTGQFNLIVSAVPEPSTMLLFGMGLAGLWAARRRRTKRDA